MDLESTNRGPRSLVRDGQTSPHRPRLVVSPSTCPPLSLPHANSFVEPKGGGVRKTTYTLSNKFFYTALRFVKGYCSNKHINTHIYRECDVYWYSIQ